MNAIGYKGITDWRISNIEALTEADAATICESRETIKGHNVYFIDFAGYFGYSALVYFDGAYIHYANDYELHHKGRTRDELHTLYRDAMTNKLFTDDELETIADYDDYERKSYFIRNLYTQRVPHVSAFRICITKAEEEAFSEEVKGLHFNPVSFCYMSDTEFITRQAQLMDALEAAKDKAANDYEYHKAAFIREMFNHEYGINYQADYDTLSAFGPLNWSDDDPESYMQQLNFNDTQKRAYYDARREYFATASL